jgi:hypothetical protein
MMSIATGMDGFHCFVLPLFLLTFSEPSFALLYFTYAQLISRCMGSRRKPFALVPESLFPQTCMAGFTILLLVQSGRAAAQLSFTSEAVFFLNSFMNNFVGEVKLF